MDEEKVREAIEALKYINLKSVHPFYNWEEMMEVRDTAIEALEKQLPKKVDFEEDVTEDVCVECHSCGCFLGYQVDCLDENYQIDYCKHCGQRIDWSE